MDSIRVLFRFSLFTFMKILYLSALAWVALLLVLVIDWLGRCGVFPSCLEGEALPALVALLLMAATTIQIICLGRSCYMLVEGPRNKQVVLTLILSLAWLNLAAWPDLKLNYPLQRQEAPAKTDLRQVFQQQRPS